MIDDRIIITDHMELSLLDDVYLQMVLWNLDAYGYNNHTRFFLFIELGGLTWNFPMNRRLNSIDMSG